MGRCTNVTHRKRELRHAAMLGKKKEDRWLVDVYIEHGSASLENGTLGSACMP
jgi:hypothetical protein